MKLGAQIRLPDGRVGTAVFKGLVGVGIKWGLHNPDPDDFRGTCGDLAKIGVYSPDPPEEWDWEPDALLRDRNDSLEAAGWECVGTEYELIREGVKP